MDMEEIIERSLVKIAELENHPKIAEMKAVGIEFRFEGVDPNTGMIMYYLENADNNGTKIERGAHHFTDDEANPDAFGAHVDHYIKYAEEYNKDGDIDEVGAKVLIDEQKAEKIRMKKLKNKYIIEGDIIRGRK